MVIHSPSSSVASPAQPPSSSSLHHRHLPSAGPDSGATLLPQSFELSPILLVSTLDGQLHALDRKTGIWNWTLTDPNPSPSSNSLDRPVLVNSPFLSSPQSQSDQAHHHHQHQQHQHQHQHHELYAIEPQNDGDLYVFITSPSQPSRLEKLPLSVSQLVNLSPFTFPGDSSKMFIGKKETHLIAVDLKTGLVVNFLHSKPKRASSKRKQKSNFDQCDPQSPFLSSPSPAHGHPPTSPVDPSCSNPSKTKTDDSHQSIHQRPRDLLYIGRTDYEISIYSKPNTLIQTLRYSTYSPSNLPHTLQSMWSQTPDELYLEPTHDGHLVCFQATPQVPGHPSTQSERTQIKWQNSFDQPVTNIFDIVFPNPPLRPSTPLTPNPSFQDPGKNNPYHNPPADATSQTVPVQQPIIFVQPKFLSSLGDRSQHRVSPDDHFDFFEHLHSQTSSSTSSPPPRDSTGKRRAFVGKFQDSFYVMSQQSYPLVAFAPSAYETPSHEPSVGTHHLLNSRALSGFLDFSLTNRLLDPTLPHHHHHHPSHRFPRTLDPPPLSPPTLPPSQASDHSTLKGEQPISNHSPPSTNLPKSSSDPEPLSSEKAISPIQLQQRAAQISSLLVRTFREQLMLKEPDSSQSSRLSDLNPLLTIFLVLVIMSWWASRKVSSPSTARWDHLHQLVNQALGHDTPKLEPASHFKSLGVPNSQDEQTTTIEATTVTSTSKSHHDSLHPEPRHHNLTPDQSDLLNPNLSTSKQKPKRRRGKRPGQKAAAAAAKAEAQGEAEAAKALVTATLFTTASPLPGSEGLALTTSKSPSPSPSLSLTTEPNNHHQQRSKLNTRKGKSNSTKTLETISNLDRTDPITPPSRNQFNATLTLSHPPAPSFTANGQHFAVNQPIDSNQNSIPDPQDELEPQRVGSLMITNETIGYGSHGTVVLKGTFQGRQVAVKRLLKDFVTLASHEVSLLQESDDHPNVVRYFVKESLDNFLYIALELCNASLFDLIERRTFKEYDELNEIFNAKKALKQITSGLRYLHKLKIVHRDIKPQNILISITRPLPTSSKAVHKSRGGIGGGKTFRMLISDFGLCKKLELDESSFAQTAHHAAGSFGYRAPEILKGQVNLSELGNSSSSLTNSTVQNLGGSGSGPITTNGDSNGSSNNNSNHETPSHHRLTRSIDIFSLGCIYYYVLTKGEHPFGSRYEREINILKDEVCLDQLDGFDEEAFEAQQLVRSMIKSNPKERPTAEEVLQNPYFWEASKRLNFLCDCSDRFEIMERDPPEKLLIELEDQEKFFRYLNHHHHHHRPSNQRLKGLDWYKIIDKPLIDNLGRYRKYDGGSIRDLLRVMRNKKHHFQDLPDSLKRTLGEVPEGFLNYFTRKFPSLLVHVYDIILNSNLKFETLFSNTYFQILDEI